jgi:hypothetical protein
MTEDKFEKFIKQTAPGYNTPPARVPREEMWSAIQAKRTAGPRVVYGGGLASDEVPVRRFGRRVWLGAAAAAMLLVATGVGIGRWTAAPNGQAASAIVTLPPAVAIPEQGGTAPAGEINVGTVDQGSRPGSASPDNRVAAGTSTPRGVNRSGGSQVAANTPASAQSPSSAYQLTAVRHLSEAEALLTSFRQRTTADQQMDAQLGAWARQLLSTTRLLLDSPVANDPQRRPLLQDLELVLVQIVQLSPGAAPQDRDLIEKTLQQEHVLTRLRTAIPAGSQRGS